jgi:hypothetical protein
MKSAEVMIEIKRFTSQWNEATTTAFWWIIFVAAGLKQAPVQVVNWAKGSRTKQRAAAVVWARLGKRGGVSASLFCENEAGARARDKRTKVLPDSRVCGHR